MRRASQRNGFALVAVLILAAAACLLAAASVAAVSVRQQVAADDSRGARAKRHAATALADVCDRLRWTPHATRGARAGTLGDATWTASWEPVSGAVTPTIKLNVTSRVSTAAATLEAQVALVADPVARGVVVSDWAHFDEAATISGSGLYVGGDVAGRDLLDFTSASGGVPALDGVHGHMWPLAAVHAGGEIHSSTGEIHLAAQAPLWPHDTDRHTADERPLTLTRPPAAELLAALREHAAATGTLFTDDVLDLSEIPPDEAAGSDGDAGAAAIVVSDPAAGTVRIRGALPAGSRQVVLIVLGDARIGEPNVPRTELPGSLVVSGSLAVHGPSHVRGHLYAAQLSVVAPMTVDVPDGSSLRTLPGLTAPTIVALSDGHG
jgi:hypothetical protein